MFCKVYCQSAFGCVLFCFPLWLKLCSSFPRFLTFPYVDNDAGIHGGKWFVILTNEKQRESTDKDAGVSLKCVSAVSAAGTRQVVDQNQANAQMHVCSYKHTPPFPDTRYASFTFVPPTSVQIISAIRTQGRENTFFS